MFQCNATASSNSTSYSSSSSPSSSPAFGYLVLTLVPLVAVFGNALVILAVIHDKKLKSSVTNRYTAALAFSDLIVGLVPMPFAVYVKVNGDRWTLGVTLCRLYVACDVVSSTASILHLALISADRYLAIMWPHEYQRYAKTAKISFPIALVWLISITISIPVIMGKSILNSENCWLENPEYMLYSSLLSFYIPAGVMTLMYVKIFRKLNRLKAIRSMLRASGAMCGGETGAPFGLPLVVVQEVSYPRPVPSTNHNNNQDKLQSESNPEHTSEPCQLSNAVAVATDKMLVAPKPSVEPNQGREENGEKKYLLQEGKLKSSPSTFRSALLLPGRTADTSDDDNNSQTRLIRKPPPEERKKSFQKRSISTMTRRPCVVSTRRLSFWLSSKSSEEFSIDTSLASSSPSLDGDRVKRARRNKCDSKRVIERFDSAAWAEEMLKEQRQLERRLAPLTRARPIQNTNQDSPPVYTVPVTVTTGGTGGTFRRIANRFTSALNRKTEKQALAKEKRATKMVAMILGTYGVFIICWLPFFTFNTVRGICLSSTDYPYKCDWLPAELFFLTTWLGYANSGFNPIIYGLVNEQFRITYQKLLRWPIRYRRSSWTSSPTSAG